MPGKESIHVDEHSLLSCSFAAPMEAVRRFGSVLPSSIVYAGYRKTLGVNHPPTAAYWWY